MSTSISFSTNRKKWQQPYLLQKKTERSCITSSAFLALKSSALPCPPWKLAQSCIHCGTDSGLFLWKRILSKCQHCQLLSQPIHTSSLCPALCHKHCKCTSSCTSANSLPGGHRKEKAEVTGKLQDLAWQLGLHFGNTKGRTRHFPAD